MKIITISREFGSGGRELGKRLADAMDLAYYDREIITAIAENKGLDENYVETLLTKSIRQSTPLHFRNTFASTSALQKVQTQLLLEQKQVIEAIAKTGKDCVIVGRNADVLLSEYKPFNIFVCADPDTKIQRIMERAEADEQLSPKEIQRKIRIIDKSRRQNREILTDLPWGERSAYHLTINTTHWNMKELVPAVAEFAQRWFQQKV